MKPNLNLERYLGFLDVPSKPLIGVDITASTIKIVELSKKRNGQISFDGYAIEPTPKDAFNDQGIANQDALAAGLERAWKRLGSSVKNVALALPTNQAINKRAHFPKELDDAQLEDEVMDEASQYLPFPLEEVNVDWRIMGPHPNNPDVENEVLICAARKDRIDDYRAVAEAAGLKVTLMDIESYAQQAAFYQLAQSLDKSNEQVIAVADAGSSILNINVFHRGQVIFSKDIPFGGNQLTETISSLYDISSEKAEEAKRNNGQGLDGFEERALRPFLESLAMEINRALQFFLTQATVERIDTIILAGGCASFPGVDQSVADISQIPALIANPFAAMEHSSRVKNKPLIREAPLLMTACGLALRRFDK